MAWTSWKKNALSQEGVDLTWEGTSAREGFEVCVATKCD